MKQFRFNTIYYKVLILIIIVIFLITSLLLTIQYTQTSSKHASQQTLNHFATQKIHKTMQQQHIPGMSVLLIQHQDVILNKGFGFQNQAKHQHATEHTQYEIASNTKAFTGFAVLQLADKKKIDLKAPVTDYLPWLHFNYHGKQAKVTIEQVIAQTSGIDDRMSSEKEGELSKNEDNLKARVKSINNEELKDQPGKNFNYANMNYNVLGLIIEQVSHQSYESYIRQNILMPLHMKQTYFKTEAASPLQKRHLAQGYIEKDGHAEPDNPDYFKGDTPAAYMISSTAEIVPRVQKQLNPTGTDKSLIEYSHQSDADTPHDVNASQYATGWFLNPDENQVLHPGTLPNYSSFILLNTKDKNAVVIFANLNSRAVPDLARTLNHQLEFFDQYHHLNDNIQKHALIISILIWIAMIINAVVSINISHMIYQYKHQHFLKRYQSKSINNIISMLTLIFIILIGIVFYKTPSWMIHSIKWESALLGFSPPLIILILLVFITILLFILRVSLLLLWKNNRQN
ncbi:hypothetical protein CD149_07260 [Staphylococcus condimenti]|uniref:Beta-lactamase family protein n=2 Tax=Staphylococcus condimenti TaxID=70255 RepID=A0AB37H8M5_9STAP|nr:MULTISPECIES: serine hydrolase domain-containing protein [Staphylococcus]AMY06339.1 hypothetical protein A4G25_10540 [Staphylococcus condimenti]APR60222.1 hypothetical protein BTZ13_02955 [Staphylococcus condimenti]MDK8644321.1 serine hydrolase domain-containing protein [Staphylococcus condimenti]OFP00183.1 hypothetical protein HMPREF3007_11385 [Staphylococcus sp. HMSC065E08]PNZ60493.1 hypothetical protein CD149_07260 [Staphylococcus condimenti]